VVQKEPRRQPRRRRRKKHVSERPLSLSNGSLISSPLFASSHFQATSVESNHACFMFISPTLACLHTTMLLVSSTTEAPKAGSDTKPQAAPPQAAPTKEKPTTISGFFLRKDTFYILLSVWIVINCVLFIIPSSLMQIPGADQVNPRPPQLFATVTTGTVRRDLTSLNLDRPINVRATRPSLRHSPR